MPTHGYCREPVPEGGAGRECAASIIGVQQLPSCFSPAKGPGELRGRFPRVTKIKIREATQQTRKVSREDKSGGGDPRGRNDNQGPSVQEVQKASCMQCCIQKESRTTQQAGPERTSNTVNALTLLHSLTTTRETRTKKRPPQGAREGETPALAEGIVPPKQKATQQISWTTHRDSKEVMRAEHSDSAVVLGELGPPRDDCRGTRPGDGLS